MLGYIILLADQGAVSFCHYHNEEFDKNVSEFIPISLFKKIVDFTKSHDLVLNIILGRKKLPNDYYQILRNTNYTLIVPYELIKTYPEAVPVIDLESVELQSIDLNARLDSMIIRFRGYPMTDLRKIIRRFADNTKRINLIIKDIQVLTEENLTSYQYQLNKLVPLLSRLYQNGNSLELNCISDRIILNEMNNCNAGINHVTYAPNGRFYICPGFYYSNPQNDIGSMETVFEFLHNKFLRIENAPICSVCDAFQCKRCVYLNKITTNELNTPSRQQCVLSHMERNSSRSLFRQLRKSVLNHDEFSDIPELDYLDPLEILQEQKSFNKIKLYRICRREI
jgi:CXXX repeat peptide maturase